MVMQRVVQKVERRTVELEAQYWCVSKAEAAKSTNAKHRQSERQRVLKPGIRQGSEGMQTWRMAVTSLTLALPRIVS